MRTLLLALVLAAVGCSAPSSRSHATGSAEVVAVTSSALSSDVANVKVTIDGAGINPAITTNLAHFGNRYQGIIGAIPAGPDRSFRGSADDADGHSLYAGTTDGVTIEAGKEAVVALVLQETHPADPFANDAPLITSVYLGSDDVAPGATIAVSATATDADDTDLHYAWTATKGIFTHGDQADATWTAPAVEGAVTFTLRVTDPKGAAAAVSFDVNVTANVATGTASVSATFNDAPTVTSMTSDVNPLSVGSVTKLGVEATDIDDPMASASYQWSSTCDGVFSSTTDSAPTFTLHSETDSSCGFTVKVTDGRGGWNTGTLSVPVGTAVQVTAPPTVESMTQSAFAVDANGTVTFSVTAHAFGEALTYNWASETGPIASTTSSATWTAPACMAGDAHVRVTVANASGTQSTTQVFTVTPGAADGCGVDGVERADRGNASNDGSFEAALSRDRNFVVFASYDDFGFGGRPAPGDAPHLQIYRRDRRDGTLALVSVATDGSPGNGESQIPTISGDGQLVAFETSATNLTADTSSFGVFIRDMASGVTVRVPTGPYSQAESPALSSDGRHICLTTNDDFGTGSGGNNVWELDLARSPNLVFERAPRQISGVGWYGYAGWCALSGDGSVVSYSYGATAAVRDLAHGTSYAFDAYAGTALSDDGTTLAFGTWEALIPDDTNDGGDVYVRTLATNETWLASKGLASSGVGAGALSADGSVVAFAGQESSTQPYNGVFVSDRASPTPRRISLREPWGNWADSGGISLSNDASTVAMASNAYLDGIGFFGGSRIFVLPVP